jgi:sugar fermentation stimulation protein A
VAALFLHRDNRFRVQVQIDDQIVTAHLPNSGRLGELLVPGREVWLTPADPAALGRRRTAYSLALVEYAGRLVSVNAHLPGDLVAKALGCQLLAPFAEYAVVKREVTLGQSRIDFFLSAQDHPSCWLETKSVTLVNEGTAQFPDAPTARGLRHVLELTRAVERGEKAAVLFVVQRDDAQRFTPHDAADPAFGQALRQAVEAGVAVHALRCCVTREAIQTIDFIPVVLQ